MRSHAARTPVLLLVLPLLAACSDDAGASGSGGDGGASGTVVGPSSGSTGSGDGGSALVGTTSSGEGGASGCVTAQDCPPGEVCDPETGSCAGDLPCTGNDDCGPGAICSEDGECVPNEPGGPCESTADCVEGETCENGHCGCGGELYSADDVPPNVLIVLDRSSSMNEELDGGDSKWDVGRDAIAQVVAEYGDGVNFGLALYPGFDLSCNDGDDCDRGTVFVDVGPGTAAAIADALQGANTCSFGTPTAEALEDLLDYPGLEDPARGNYILLVTDGQSTCEDPVQVVLDLRNEAPEVTTFVVGFGAGVDPGELADMAIAGGTALDDPPGYYQADDSAALVDAFATIAGSVLSCSYVLDPIPPDPEGLFVFFDGVEVPRDPTHGDGWDYDPATGQITFYGAACLSLQQGLVDDLVISYGCPATTTGAGGGDPGAGGGGGGPSCQEEGESCVEASECCGGMACIDGVCRTPVPN